MNAEAKQLTIGIGMAVAGIFLSELKEPKDFKGLMGYVAMLAGTVEGARGINKLLK